MYASTPAQMKRSQYPRQRKSKSPNSFNINLATSETNIIISSHTASDDCSSQVLVGVGLRSNAAIEVQQEILFICE